MKGHPGPPYPIKGLAETLAPSAADASDLTPNLNRQGTNRRTQPWRRVFTAHLRVFKAMLVLFTRGAGIPAGSHRPVADEV